MSDLIARLVRLTNYWNQRDALTGFKAVEMACETIVVTNSAAWRIKQLSERIAELEPQADAYNFACEDMEKFQRERFEAGKEVGTQGSLCDGMAWVYKRLNELEADNARLRVDGERLDWHEQAMKVGHPSLPYWDDLGFFCYPYLVNGSPMGGGIGTVNCGQSLRAAIDAAQEQS